MYTAKSEKLWPKTHGMDLVERTLNTEDLLIQIP